MKGAADPMQIRQGMGVIASDDRRVGTVDSLDGNRIRLVRRSKAGHHVPVSMIAAVDDENIYLNALADKLLPRPK